MKIEPNISNICEECDYSPALCDGDVYSCVSASLKGANSEIAQESGAFEKHHFHNELEPYFER